MCPTTRAEFHTFFSLQEWLSLQTRAHWSNFMRLHGLAEGTMVPLSYPLGASQHLLALRKTYKSLNTWGTSHIVSKETLRISHSVSHYSEWDAEVRVLIKQMIGFVFLNMKTASPLWLSLNYHLWLERLQWITSGLCCFKACLSVSGGFQWCDYSATDETWTRSQD